MRFPEDEVQGDFPQGLDGDFHVARLARRGAINKIPKRAALDPLEIPGALEAGGIEGAKARIALQLQQWIVRQKQQLIVVSDAAGNLGLEGIERIMMFVNEVM